MKNDRERTRCESKGRSDYDRLLFLIGRGDQEALRQLYEATARSVYSYALSILKNPQDAEEVMQDTYLAVVRDAEKYEPEGKPMAWILTIVKNLCYMYLRRQKSRVFISYEELEEEEPGQVCSGIEQAPEKQMLLDALTTLDEEERKIVLLHDVGELKHREISEDLGLPLSTVLSKYRRSIKKLEKVVDKNGFWENNSVY